MSDNIGVKNDPHLVATCTVLENQTFQSIPVTEA